MSSSFASNASFKTDSGLRLTRSENDSALFDISFYDLDCALCDAATIRKELPSLLQEVAGEKPSFVVTRIPNGRTDLSEALSESRFYHAESLARLVLKTAQLRPMDPNAEAQAPFPNRQISIGPERMEEVAQLAGRLFVFNRLNMDPHIPRDKVDERYRNWVRRIATDGSTLIGHEGVENGRIFAFVQYRPTGDGEITWFLGGLDPDFQKARIGASCIYQYLRTCKEEGWDTIYTNVSLILFPLIQTYLHFGFRIAEVVQFFHCYLPANEKR